MKNVEFHRIDENRVLLPRKGRMNVDGLVYADEAMMRVIQGDESLKQVVNVAQLPGIVKNSIAMPDIHWGYGFPIGGVAAFDADEGVISPGGVGYDINCGVRLIRTEIEKNAVGKKIRDLVAALFNNIPTGVGSHRRDFKLTKVELKKLAESGAKYMVSQGFGSAQDIERIEENGFIEGANFEVVSEKAYERGKDQVGTLGSGNHFVEVGFVEEIYDETSADAFGLFKNQITVIIHTGSRGFGHQICTDFIGVMDRAARAYGIELPDRQLCCAPIKSREGREYFAAMACAANYAFANRQLITHWIRETFESVFRMSPQDLGMNLVYDIAHNIAKFEEYIVDGKPRRVCVHRKGATRALPAHHPKTPAVYRHVGQPVLIPGDMGRYSYVLVGRDLAVEEAFGSSCHGAGRILSRHQAIKRGKGRNLRSELESRGIFVMSSGKETLAEEMPEAYKDVSDVVNIVCSAGIAGLVAKLSPLGVIKG